LLVFPSYFKRERPDLQGHPAVVVTYTFKGALDEIYATLVVRLHHTREFQKDRLWRFAADFRTNGGGRLGLKMYKKAEGKAELTVYCDEDVGEDARVTFMKYVHEHLKSKDPDVKRVRHYACPKCREPIESVRAIEAALARNERTLPCQFCGTSIEIVDRVEAKLASTTIQNRVRAMEDEAQANIDTKSNDLIVVGHALAIANQCGDEFRLTDDYGDGIDGVIEFGDHGKRGIRKRILLQLRPQLIYDVKRMRRERQVFRLRDPRQVKAWLKFSCPIMLVVRGESGAVEWIDVAQYFRRQSGPLQGPHFQVPQPSEPFTAATLQRVRDMVLHG
jgi:hypothetical protein